MALTLDNNIATICKERLVDYFIGNFQTLNFLFLQQNNINSFQVKEKDKTVLLDMEETAFFNKLNKLLQEKNDVNEPVNNSNNYLIVKDEYAYLVYFKDFALRSILFQSFKRTQTESFLTTTQNQPGNANFISTNASFFDFLNDKGYSDALIGSLQINDIVVRGQVYRNNSPLFSSPNFTPSDNYFIEKDALSIEFNAGLGDPTIGDGFGDLTPILIYNTQFNKLWKYGGGNEYDNAAIIAAGLDPVNAPQPPNAPEGTVFEQFIITRNSNKYAALNKKGGKCIFAWHKIRDVVLLIVEEDSSFFSHNLDYYRDRLYNKNFRITMGFDGGNSEMLYEYYTKNFLVPPARQKYNSNVVGAIYKR